MSDTPVLVYLEADDEITAVIRRVRAADPGRVVVVAPGRSRATSSVVALRLLARAAEADGRPVAIVGDALTRSLAAEAGIAAHATVEEARRGEPAAPAGPVEHAAIRVVRGPEADETAPTMAAAPAIPTAVGSDDVTRPVAVARPRGRRAPAIRQARSVRTLPVATIGALALLLLAGLVAAAAVLPAATIRIVPRTTAVGPLDYTVTIAEPERDSGTAEATATVTATGSYDIEERAAGSVILFNWTFFPVNVPAGTFVAAGEQAFSTQTDVTVPRGRLTGQGTIAAGDAEVAVLAAAPGPAANVDANAINVVVNESIDDRLGGVPENPEPRVLNPAPTTGGADENGVEITAEDVHRAVAELRADLEAQVLAAGEPDEASLPVAMAPFEPVITGTDGLAGTRDQPEAEIGGSFAWELIRVDRSEVEAEGRRLLLADGTATPDGHEILVETIEVRLLEARRAGEGVDVDVTVRASSYAPIDDTSVVDRVAGRSLDEARSVLAELGTVTIETWPGWVGDVPSLEWRIEIAVEPPAPSAAADSEPEPEASPS